MTTEIPVEERIYEAEAQEPTFHTIRMVKVAGGGPLERTRFGGVVVGGLPLGTEYTYTYKSLTHDEALRRASAALARDYPKENRLHWQVER